MSAPSSHLAPPRGRPACTPHQSQRRPSFQVPCLLLPCLDPPLFCPPKLPHCSSTFESLPTRKGQGLAPLLRVSSLCFCSLGWSSFSPPKPGPSELAAPDPLTGGPAEPHRNVQTSELLPSAGISDLLQLPGQDDLRDPISRWGASHTISPSGMSIAGPWTWQSTA